MTSGATDIVFQQYYLECLSQASYLIGDRTTKRAVLVDPRRDVQEYLNDAAAGGLTITHVIETHFHADFLSGHLEVAEHTGATIVFGAAARGRVEFPALFAADGERIDLGAVSLEIVETPGHTPESVCVIVHEAGVAEPWGVLTGDTLFIGDVGRPDLLSSAGHGADDLARHLYRSLHERLLPLPDGTRVYPAHGAGSACGKNLSTETSSTIGEQRATNYALAPMSEDVFVDLVTAGQPTAPMYFRYAADTNRRRHDTLDEDQASPPLTLDEVDAAAAAGAAIIDGRDPTAFATGHLAGSINVGLAGRFAEYVGEVVAPGTPIVVVADDGAEHEAKVRLARIGFDQVVGHLAGGEAALSATPDRVERASRLTAPALAARLAADDAITLVDVRGPGETAAGTIPGAVTIPLPALVSRLDELDPNRPTVAYCAGGYRSSIAASTLRARGFADASDLLGGITAWEAAGQPLARA